LQSKFCTIPNFRAWPPGERRATFAQLNRTGDNVTEPVRDAELLERLEHTVNAFLGAGYAAPDLAAALMATAANLVAGGLTPLEAAHWLGTQARTLIDELRARAHDAAMAKVTP
jgi:hypothetical protein